MDRRSFLGSLGLRTVGIGATGLATMGGKALPGAVRKPPYYQLDQYLLKNGSQVGRIHEFLKGSMKFFSGPRIILDGLVAPHMPQVVVIQGHSSIGEFLDSEAKRKQNADYRAALTAWEAGDEAPYESFSTSLLEATPYSPGIGESSKSPRIFELRTYHSPQPGNLPLSTSVSPARKSVSFTAWESIPSCTLPPLSDPTAQTSPISFHSTRSMPGRRPGPPLEPTPNGSRSARNP